MRRALLLTALLIPGATARAQAVADIVIDEAVPAAGEFFDVPFEVPAGTVEIQIAHAALDPDDVLDFGVFAPEGFRGYAGGDAEDAIIGELASSTSYLPGPITPGTWTLYVGKARVDSAAPRYHVEITFRTTATLAPSTDRAPYVAAPPLSTAARFYAGDFHVHSEDSGDARPPLSEIGAFARGRGLDFVVITDHNTISQVDRLGAAQAAQPELLFVPGMEFTTYAGHATVFGATGFVDHRIGHAGHTLAAALDRFASQGALVSINHPTLDLGDACIGCAWEHGSPAIGAIQGVEIETGGWRQSGRFFTFTALELWEAMLDEGHHLAAIGGSDDHQAGQSNGSPIGDPTTLVFANGLSVSALRDGILNSRTVVKLQGPDDPMIVLDTTPARVGDTAQGDEVTLTATVTGGVGSQFRFVRNALGVDLPVEVTTDPQSFTVTLEPNRTLTDRVRAEVQVLDGTELVPRTITSYVWLAAGPPDICACGASSRGPAASGLAALVALGLVVRRPRVGGHRAGPRGRDRMAP